MDEKLKEGRLTGGSSAFVDETTLGRPLDRGVCLRGADPKRTGQLG